MTLRSRSCVIGRGVAMFSICSAMAFASKIPTQIGRTRWPSLSRRITIGMFVMGSTINPLMVISICMALQPRRPRRVVNLLPGRGQDLTPDAVGTGAPDAHGQRAADPVRRPGHVDHHVRTGPAREFGLAPAA